ncbi:hypothetical protein M1P56_30065 [Streptomyces sp. HU2014]|uniref:hypothetical protein n=1 Tax=Streptomyces sp. HU2014 TaxID=2939414 RepID=UPI00200DA135|nr:hypothetical protein [Streptomyces sp. HU2014]UQI48263.1 hypothetical protein M1P56_30065 [Streptomyces sp. HU2014]
MADDHRYDWLEDWLDDDAVERLLSAPAGAECTAEAPAPPTPGTRPALEKEPAPEPGPALETPLAPAPPEAAALLAALRSLTPPPAAPGSPLPGEEAALAAFRAARAASAPEAAPTTGTASLGAAPATSADRPTRVDAAGTDTSVTSGPGAPVIPIAAGRRRRFGRRWRPVEVGVAMALAGCALGGVAVAAGTGVLPAPFKRSTAEPAAGASVSALENGGAGSTEPGAPGATPSRGKDDGPRESGRPSASATPGADATAGHGGGRNAGPGASPSETRRRHDGDTREDRDGGGRNDDRDDRKDDGKETGAGDGATTLATRLCRDYLTAQRRRDAVDENDMRALERAAGAGAAAIRKYCEKLLDGAGAPGGVRNLPARGSATGTASGLGGAQVPAPLPSAQGGVRPEGLLVPVVPAVRGL